MTDWQLVNARTGEQLTDVLEYRQAPYGPAMVAVTAAGTVVLVPVWQCGVTR